MSKEDNSSKAAVMKPPSGPLSIRQRVKIKKPAKTALEEEEFTEAMTTIIRRDFFPDNAKLEAQLDYLEASDANDYDRLREISERFATTSHTPAPPTPSTFETPSSTPSSQGKSKRSKKLDSNSGSPEPKKQKPEDSKSLDKFLHKYHSEDDASFGELLEKAEEERERKNAWLYEKEAEYQNPLPLTSGEERLAITDGSKAQGSAPKTWNYTAKNSLMYIPDTVEDNAKESIDKSIKRREIAHSNTRLSRDFLRKSSTALSRVTTEGEGVGAKKSNDKIGVDGKMVAESETPRVNGYGFVATPQIHPGVDASPLMTWGTIDGTPLRLETDVIPTTAQAFSMPDVPKREAMGHKLAEKAAQANKDRKKAASLAASSSLLRRKLGATPTVNDRLQMLSPAARKLVSRTSTPAGHSGGTDHALRASYTPTHRRSESGTPRLTTPTTGGSTPSLTDNLLKLGSR